MMTLKELQAVIAEERVTYEAAAKAMLGEFLAAMTATIEKFLAEKATEATRLDPVERSTVSRAKVAASLEVDHLIAIIERLSGEVVPGGDEIVRGKAES